MLSRLFEFRDGKPREPVFWLVLASVAATQLLAFYALCSHQVREAQTRREAVVVERVAHHDCLEPRLQVGGDGCSAPLVPGADASGQSRVYSLLR